MNILRLIAEEKEKKLRPHASASPEFKKLEDQATASAPGPSPIKYDQDDLKKKLTPVQYYVTQQKGTERAHTGKFCSKKDEGIYTCVVCDNPLFKSEQKFASACGWPSFQDVIAQGTVTLKKDMSKGLSRIEVSCSQCGAHVGHVFDDGPKPSRIRYCVNSSSLEFKKHTTV